MKIIICGKGGCGKSTLATLLAKEYQKKGRNVLVVDSDESNFGLYRQLGLDLPEDFTHYFGGKKGVYRVFDDKGCVFDRQWRISDIPADYISEDCLSESGNLRLLSIGKIAEAEEGCACGMGFTAKSLLENLALEDNDVVIVDTEAGVEHFGRGLDRFADAILMVVDPSYESIHLSGKIFDMGQSLGKPVYFIINKADSQQAEMIRSAIREPDAVIAEIPSDTGIMMAGLKGDPLDADIPAVREIAHRMDTI